MAIQKISLNNFTVFNKLEIRLSEGINVFIGENGTGKTHLLKLLYTFCQASVNCAKSSWIDKFTVLLNNNFFSSFNTLSNQTEIRINDEIVYDHKLNEIKPISSRHESDTITEAGYENFTYVFIPAKETLSMSNITRIHDKFSKELDIDNTLIDIIKQAQNIKPDKIPDLAKIITPKLEEVMDGTIFVKTDNNTFWVRKNDGREIPFTLEAEGFRKLGLLWQLLMNESITKDTILFWDEPEANINPKIIPIVVELLLELTRHGVQIFVATHDYFFANFLEVRKNKDDRVLYHGLHKSDDGSGILCESQNHFKFLEKNSIIEQSINLYKEEVKKVMD